jgi:hypothetical protein
MSDFKPGDRVTVVIPIFKGIGDCGGRESGGGLAGLARLHPAG